MLSLSLSLIVSSISHAPDVDPSAVPDPEAPIGPRSYLGLADADQKAPHKVGSMTVAVDDSALKDSQLAVGDTLTVTISAPNKPRAGAYDGVEPPVGLVQPQPSRDDRG